MVRPLRRSLSALVLSAVLLGCASTRSVSPGVPYDRHRITAAEVEQSTALTALELVQRARPEWLSSRGQDTFRGATRVVVYVNNQRYGTVERLRELQLRSIRELQFLDSRTATQRFGTGHGAGVILVIFR